MILPMLARYGKLRLASLLHFYPFFAASYAALVVYIALRGHFMWKGRELQMQTSTATTFKSRLQRQPLLRRLRASVQ